MSIIINPSTGQNIINVLTSVSDQINIVTQDSNNINLLNDTSDQINIVAQDINNINVLAGGLSITDHNFLTNLQGGETNEYYHLNSDEYSNLVTGEVIRPNQTGQFYPTSNPSGFITGINNIVYTSGNQNIGDIKTFTNNIIGNGTNNLFVNEAGSSPHSLLTQQQLMLNGHRFRQLVHVSNRVGYTGQALPATIASAFQVLGMKASIANAATHWASAFTLDGLFCTDVSLTSLPINNEIDVYFHGVAMQFQLDANWVARINFGVPFSRTPPPTNNLGRLWGVEFYWSGISTTFYGRLYYCLDGTSSTMVYGSAFILPIYTGALPPAWGGFVYSIRMRQVVIGSNRLRLEFYINESTSNSGGNALSKTTPIATLETITVPNPNFRTDGKHINFEVVASDTLNPSGQVRIQCTNMYCQFK